MPTKPNRKHPKPRHAKRSPNGPKRSPNGRFKGQPRTISETSMPDEYAPGAEAPREAQSDTRQTATAATETDPAQRTVKAESPSGYFYTLTYCVPRRPWYRRLWEWLT